MRRTRTEIGIREILGFALKGATDAHRDDGGCGLIDELGGCADGDVFGEIEEDGDRGELVDVVDGLGAEDFFPFSDRGEGDDAEVIIGADIEQGEIGWMGTVLVGGFEDDLELIFRFFDQVNVILGIGLAKGVFDAGG